VRCYGMPLEGRGGGDFCSLITIQLAYLYFIEQDPDSFQLKGGYAN
jgi:hypothetical protein